MLARRQVQLAQAGQLAHADRKTLQLLAGSQIQNDQGTALAKLVGELLQVFAFGQQ
jgi:hypothetical protein